MALRFTSELVVGLAAAAWLTNRFEAEESASKPACPEVVAHDDEEGDRPEPIQGNDALLSSRRWSYGAIGCRRFITFPKHHRRHARRCSASMAPWPNRAYLAIVGREQRSYERA